MADRPAFHILVATAMAALLGAVEATARAEPETSVGLTAGAAFQRMTGPGPIEPSFHLGARADALWLRGRDGQMALGPFVDVATAAFRSADLGAGMEWLVPLTQDVAAIPSAGGFVREGEGRSWVPGVEGTLFVGARSFNFHSWYGMGNGLFVQARWVPATPATVDFIVGAQIDLEVVVLPFLLVGGLVSHGS